MRKINFPVIMLTAFFIICWYPIGISANTAAEKVETEKLRQVVARVNGQPIYEDELTPHISRELRKFKKFSPKRDTSALEERLKEKVLDKVISQEVLNQESRRLEIKDIDKQVQEKFDEMKKKYKDEEHFNKMLEAKKNTQKGMREKIRDNIYLTTYLKQKGISDPEIPEEEIKEYYESNKRSFTRKESVEAHHILIKVDQSAATEEKEKAREKAEQVLKEIKEGKDFAEMAKEHSTDGAAPGGGNLGFIYKGYMPPEFDEAAFSLDAGMISDVVQTRHGYHIIKVTDKKPGGVSPYPDVKDFIKKYLQEDKYKEKLASHVKELRSKAKIEILPKES